MKKRYRAIVRYRFCFPCLPLCTANACEAQCERQKEKKFVITLSIPGRDTARRALRLCYFLAFPKK